MTKVLVVEDEAITAMDIEGRLIRSGHQVCGTASTGERAIKLALDSRPELILMDIRIKGDIDGIETAERLRQLADIPIVYLTAHADEETLRRAKGTEPYGYVVKPFEDRELVAAIEMGLHRHELTVRHLREANERLQREIRERQRVEEALRESEERYALAVRGSSDGIWDWSLSTNHFYTSPRWREMLGYQDGEMEMSPAEWLDRIHPDDRDRVRVLLDAHLTGSTAQFETEYRILHRDGSYRWMLCRGVATRDDQGRPHRIAGSQTDITDRKRAEEQLAYDAFHDALTGLPNRALFMDRLALEIERAKRRPDHVYAVLFLDLDGFKGINDRLGHTAGDQLLASVATRFRGVVRAADTLARFGGDEFVCLLADVSSEHGALEAAERVKAQLLTPFAIADQLVYCSASIGVVLSDNGSDYQRADDVLRDADIAMYRAKHLGRNRIEVFQLEQRADVMARLQLEHDLNRALANQEFVVHYQPIYDLSSGNVVGFEALVRWQHPRLGLLLPGEFLSVAEETGVIGSIDEFVLREACRQLKEWQSSRPSEPPLYVSVNLSAETFSRPDLPEVVSDVVREFGLSGSSLRLELTERVLVDNFEASAAMLNRIRKAGVKIDIDDFGTGYSSLQYLYQLPVDRLKIDRFFVERIADDAGMHGMIKTILGLAHGLSLDVTGEGVETLEQLQKLRSLGCEYGQGYLMGRPLDVEEAGRVVREARAAPDRTTARAGATAG